MLSGQAFLTMNAAKLTDGAHENNEHGLSSLNDRGWWTRQRSEWSAHAKRRSRNAKDDIIIGGNIDTPPGILHSAETPELQEFTKQMWNEQVPINEAVERLNLLDDTQKDGVIDNFMDGTDAIKSNGKDLGGASNRENGDPDGRMPDTSQERSETTEGTSVGRPDVGNDTAESNTPIDSNRLREDSKAEEVIGYVAPVDYIDEEQYRKETEDHRHRVDGAGGVDDDDDVFDSDDEHPTGIEEVNYAALTESELELVLTLIQSTLEDPGSHEEILKELLAGDTGGLTEAQCREYFDRFRRIGDILIALSETVGMKPLDTRWIPEIQMRIRDFISDSGHEVSSIRWTERDVIVALKDVVAEEKAGKLHEALAQYLRTDAGEGFCPGIKNVGLLLYTDTTGSYDSELESASKDKNKGISKGRGGPV
ncbi:zinc finger containing protein 469, putative [Babesia ovata]|uniref:Zinc finger containing protein 469, putative n=1 Tax=Babesia ovata TaxID=189622 RepID=A0A2H6KDH8_9APIC|nr:zinc finger containing protein 469, putative [Babesia ovata]GBE61046.1 zinc finger containing protein 469, putative [Babesia ovata]